MLGKLPTPPPWSRSIATWTRPCERLVQHTSRTCERSADALPPSSRFLLVQALASEQSINMAARSPSPAPRGRTDENIFLFVPNLIGPSLSLSLLRRPRERPLTSFLATGYTRVILGALALTYMPTHPKFCTFAYCVSALLDAVDGVAARALGQTSKFGAILDMVTDRCVSGSLPLGVSTAFSSSAPLARSGRARAAVLESDVGR